VTLAVDATPDSELAITDTHVVAWQGTLYNRAELLAERGLSAQSSAAAFAALWQIGQAEIVAECNGQFAFAIYDRQRQVLTLGRDHLGIRTLYSADTLDHFLFASHLQTVTNHPALTKQLNQAALQRYLIFNYNPGWDTLFAGIDKVRPAHLVHVSAEKTTTARYWQLTFPTKRHKDIDAHGAEIRRLMRSAVDLRVDSAEKLGVFVSGGLDSSSVASLAHDAYASQLQSYAYRCLGKSFDESHYARIMADYCESNHHELVYTAEDVQHSAAMIAHMQEPFADVGINMATYLLGQIASTEIDNVLTGDGGDELFGGHPVYVADKAAAPFNFMPDGLRSALFALPRRLPDSDQKLNPAVKAKRFAESMVHPADLGTQRWRVYYTPEQLRQLLPDSTIDVQAIFSDVIDINRTANGPDRLSRSLAADFETVLRFSLRRMDLVRQFGITPHFPLLDHRLVTYSAAIPSQLKIRGLSDAKYIQRSAVAPLLPHEIAFRDDKLGHSIPFKNWLRENDAVKMTVRNLLDGPYLQTIGVDSAEIGRMWDNHQAKRQNNSHRLWALAVLELWLAQHALT
jgi:asparagine synthase (glutamine-hydrolysing)